MLKVLKEIHSNNTTLEPVDKFKYLGTIITDKVSKPEVLSRIAQAQTALTKLKVNWKDKNIQTKSKVRLMRSLVISVLLYACETWTLNVELEKRIPSFEMRCHRKPLGIHHSEHITNAVVKSTIN